METFSEYLSAISDKDHRDRMEKLLLWVLETFPALKPVIAWNQPMFTDHGTFIIGFSVSKMHLAAAPERAGILHFSEAIERAGFRAINYSVSARHSRIESLFAFRNIRNESSRETNRTKTPPRIAAGRKSRAVIEMP